MSASLDDDYFKPLCLGLPAAVATTVANRVKKECPVRSPRTRSIRFADEKENARMMLETVLLFEPDDSFSESSIMEAMMDESCSSFDSYEYANGGNCPSPTSVNDIDFTDCSSSNGSNDPSSKVPPVIMANVKGPSVEEIEREVREQQARERAEAEAAANKQRNSAPAVLFREKLTAPVEAAQQVLKAEERKLAREEEKQQAMEEARKIRIEEASDRKREEEQEEEEAGKEEQAHAIRARQSIANRRVSFEQAAILQQHREDEQERARITRDEELRKIKEQRETDKLKKDEKAKQLKVKAVHQEEEENIKQMMKAKQDEQAQKMKEEQAGQKKNASPTKNKPKREGQEQRKLQEIMANQRKAREAEATRTRKEKEHREEKSKEQGLRQRMAQRDAELLRKAREEAAIRQQRAKEEALSLNGAVKKVSGLKDTIELTAARNAKLSMQKRRNELQDVGTKSLVGANVYNRRERAIVKIQASARRFLVLDRLRYYKRHRASIRIQKITRAFLVRNHMEKVKSKIAGLEEHLKAMEEAKQDELKSIQNNPELQELIDQLDDAVTVRKNRELKRERTELRHSISSIKDLNERIAQNMENLRINNRKIAKHTRYLEEQIPYIEHRIRILEKTHNQFQEKSDGLSAKVDDLEFQCDQVASKFESESRVSDLAHDTILKIRELVKNAAKTSRDPFLAKIRKRSTILERINKSSEHKGPGQSCPCPILSR